jgi:hypothetical protein
MTQPEFIDKVNAQIKRCQELLTLKEHEYASEDRLSAFKQAAVFMNCTPPQALLGMWTKHLTSISKMISSGEAYSPQVWNEKITDAINYLLLLRALVDETGYVTPVV